MPAARARRCSGWTLSGARCRNRTRSADGLCGRCAGGTGMSPPPLFAPGAVAATGPWDDIDERVRLRAARRDGTPPEALARLAEHDTSLDVRAAAAGNPGLPAETLIRLAGSSHDDIVFAVAWNDAAPPEALTRAWQSRTAPYWDDLRAAVARHPNCPSSVLAAAAEDDTSFVRSCAAANRNTEPHVLAVLADDAAASVRAAVIANPAATAAARSHAGLLGD